MTDAEKGSNMWMIYLLFFLCIIPECQAQVFTRCSEVKAILARAQTKLQPPQDCIGWRSWAERQDHELRGRLLLGDEDSLANFLLFGTSFTKSPRLTPENIRRFFSDSTKSSDDANAGRNQQVLESRVNDLLEALEAPRGNERVIYFKTLLERKRLWAGTDRSKARLRAYLTSNLVRVLNDNAIFAKTLADARRLSDASAEFAVSSKVFQSRGISLDTSLFPNYAIELALQELQSRQLLGTSTVRSVGIIGPGLDVIDKNEGYDYYPPQTVQPFAVLNSLLRLHLADPAAIRVTAMDISPRILQHLTRAREKAKQSIGYPLQLLLDNSVQWKSGTRQFWKSFGEQIGEEVTPMTPPEKAGNLIYRAVSVTPQNVLRIYPRDLDIVFQTLDRTPGEKFDLLIGTNIFVYYDELQQALAMKNMEKMLKPGGILLTNNAMPEFASTELCSRGYTVAVYSDRPKDGDLIVWYGKKCAPNADRAKE